MAVCVELRSGFSPGTKGLPTVPPERVGAGSEHRSSGRPRGPQHSYAEPEMIT